MMADVRQGISEIPLDHLIASQLSSHDQQPHAHTAGVAGVYIVDVTLRDGSTERAQVIVP
mgnify:CR=1 FL=1